MARKQGLVRACVDRDGFCQRCCRGDRLCTHHVIPIADDGSDTLDNMITLCGACHNDWHMTYEGHVPFPEWLTSIPPPRIMRIALTDPDATMAISSLRAVWTEARALEVTTLTVMRVREAA